MSRRCLKSLLLLCLISVWGLPALAMSQLTHVAVLNQGSSLGFAVNGNDSHTVFMLHQPERVVVDFRDTATRVDVSRVIRSNPLIRHVRVGHPNPHVLRFVFEMKQPVRISTVSWPVPGRGQRGWRLNVSPIRGSVSAPQRAARNVSISTVIHKPSYSNRDVIVVIDPGHGGKDAGAIGLKHSYEKNVVLSISRRLKALIDKQPGMRAVLTRDRDEYIGLRQRMMIARRHNADLFIAIHADAFENHNSHGASVFALSQRGATSEAARWLAAKENYSELGGVNLSHLDDSNGVIRSVLIDLSQTATISESLHLGHHILSGLQQVGDLHSHRVEQARFMVLKSPDIPSLLIETGFISNPREEMNLNNAAYQNRLCQAIFRGINRYFWDYPPHGSRIEAMVSKQSHRQ